MKKKNRFKILFWGPVVGGSVLWYLLFASIACKIIVPWILAGIIFAKYKMHPKEIIKTKRISRYE